MNKTKNIKNPVCHLKLPLYEDAVVGMLKIYLNKYKKSKLENTHVIVEKSMRAIELKFI